MYLATFTTVCVISVLLWTFVRQDQKSASPGVASPAPAGLLNCLLFSPVQFSAGPGSGAWNLALDCSPASPPHLSLRVNLSDRSLSAKIVAKTFSFALPAHFLQRKWNGKLASGLSRLQFRQKAKSRLGDGSGMALTSAAATGTLTAHAAGAMRQPRSAAFPRSTRSAALLVLKYFFCWLPEHRSHCRSARSAWVAGVSLFAHLQLS